MFTTKNKIYFQNGESVSVEHYLDSISQFTDYKVRQKVEKGLLNRAEYNYILINTAGLPELRQICNICGISVRDDWKESTIRNRLKLLFDE